jgi:imidazoleglycerol phosphate dehydratase HisB
LLSQELLDGVGALERVLKERKKRQRLKFFPVPLDSEIIAEVGFRMSAREHKSNTQTFKSETFQQFFEKKLKSNVDF